MIYVDGALLTSDDSSQGLDTLIALMEHPALVSTSNSLKFIQERKISASQLSSSLVHSKLVYVFQREFATVNPALVNLVGTDEATTCIGIAIRNRNSGMISVAHLDFPSIVVNGLDQMLCLVADHDTDAILDVHMIGGFDDVSSQHSSYLSSESLTELEGYSYSLCAEIINTLRNRNEKFQIQTMHVLGHNTRWDSEGLAYPIFHGFVVETSTGLVMPASFDRSSRCPDEVVRRIRVTSASEDVNWKGRLLETYDTLTDRFEIAPCAWSTRLSYFASTLQDLSDSEILQTCSTSPHAESPDFVENERRIWDYLIRHPDWRTTFPLRKPHVFHRSEDGSWVHQPQDEDGSTD